MQIGFFGLLTLLLVYCKISGQLACSWLWVFAPIWGPPTAVLACAAFVFAMAVVIATLGGD